MRLPLLPLRAAIRSACEADVALSGLLGGETGPHDEAPRGALPVYAVFGEATLRDRSTSSDIGYEQDLAVVLYARPGSAASAARAADRMAEILDEAPLTLSGHHLVRLALSELVADRDPDTRLARVTLRFSALTEVIP